MSFWLSSFAGAATEYTRFDLMSVINYTHVSATGALTFSSTVIYNFGGGWGGGAGLGREGRRERKRIRIGGR